MPQGYPAWMQRLPPLNNRRWALSVALMATGVILGWPLGVRLGWLLTTLGAGLSIFESLRRLGVWRSETHG